MTMLGNLAVPDWWQCTAKLYFKKKRH